ncbi:hypothetical protein POVWA2_013280 [Plasmodium ovale wallikeri]|uniref:Uncharacterized protein n=1 Tax=Plasmodium ovale wallikeri TaxID=864142 RepID=A0A1A8YP27_PLAOA|nr:hypothetical protein POVWA2_013280 [Plasmodium ovale wallikeri]
MAFPFDTNAGVTTRPEASDENFVSKELGANGQLLNPGCEFFLFTFPPPRESPWVAVSGLFHLTCAGGIAANVGENGYKKKKKKKNW